MTEAAMTEAATIPATPLRHVAVIPDGNRRWARARGLGAADGHRAGIARVGPVARRFFDAGAEVFTFWWGSPANLTRRRPEEVAAIVQVLDDWLVGPGAALVRELGLGFSLIGRWRELAPGIARGVAACEAAAAPGSRRRLAVLMAYDGRDELCAAVERLGPGACSHERLGGALWTAPLGAVDLLIRTGGEPHLSAGFLLWSIAEAQLAFTETLWPALDGTEVDAMIARYQARERRFGG